MLAKPLSAVAVFAAGTCIAGIGQGMSYVAAQRLLDAKVDTQQRSTAFGTFFIILYPGTALGALGLGLLTAPLGSFPAVISVASTVSILALCTVAISRRPGFLAQP